MNFKVQSLGSLAIPNYKVNSNFKKQFFLNFFSFYPIVLELL